MILAVAGSRNFTDEDAFLKAMRRQQQLHGDFILSFGDAPDGLDVMAHRWARLHRTRDQYVRHIARVPSGASRQEVWFAMHERNGRVVAKGDEMLGFYGPEGVTSGTRDAIDQARKLGIPVHVYNQFAGRWTE